jgi:N-acetyl-anhydromuramyl-L-alanine amidase AmpD
MDGWCPFATKIPMVPERYGTTNVAAGQMYPQVIVSHRMGGYFSGAIAMMQDPTVGDDSDDYASWHFSIATDGRIAQHAPIWTPTWGAGLKSGDRTDEPISTFRRRWGSNPNDWSVHVEHEDGGARNPTFTNDQIEASIRVHRWIWNQCEWLINLPRGQWYQPDTAESRFVFHSQIDPINRADDPGPNFPWDRIVNGALAAEPAPEPVLIPESAPSHIDANAIRREALAAMRAATNAAYDALEREWAG